MEVYQLAPSVFHEYCNTVKGNENITYDQACKKITRNIILAKKIPHRNEEDIQKGNELFVYGNLHILARNGTVIHIKNHKGKNAYKDWELDRFKYVDLSREMRIATE